MITKLRLTALADNRPYYRPCVILKKLVGYEVTLCCMDDDIIYVKLLGKPYRLPCGRGNVRVSRALKAA